MWLLPTYLNAWLVIVIHGHTSEPSADGNHGIVEQCREGLVLVEPLDGFPDKVQAQPILISNPPEQERHQRVMRRITLAPVWMSESVLSRGRMPARNVLTRKDPAWSVRRGSYSCTGASPPHEPPV